MNSLQQTNHRPGKKVVDLSSGAVEEKKFCLHKHSYV